MVVTHAEIEKRLNNDHNVTSDLANCVKDMFEVVFDECYNSQAALLEIAEYLLQYSHEKKISKEFKEIIDTHLISQEQMDEWEQEKKAQEDEYCRSVRVV